MKTIFYYQSPCGLEKLYSHIQDLDTIILSSIHFSSKSISVWNSFQNYGCWFNNS